MADWKPQNCLICEKHICYIDLEEEGQFPSLLCDDCFNSEKGKNI